MKKTLKLLLMLSMTTSYAFAGISFDTLKCVADKGGADRIDVKVERTMGSAPDEKIEYKESELAVGFFEGNEFEGQQVLTIELDGYSTRVYDPKKSLYILEAPNGVKIQCYINN